MKKIFLLLSVFVSLAGSAQNMHNTVSDVNSMQQIKTWVPASVYIGSDSIAHYSYYNIDSLNDALTNTTGAYYYSQGGWLSNSTSGGWIKPYYPFGVVFGNSIAEGFQTVSQGPLESGNHNQADIIGQIGYRLNQLTNMPFKNAGIGGQTSRVLRGRFLPDALGVTGLSVGDTITRPTLLHKPSIVVIEGGVNDFFKGVPIAETEENIMWMVQQCAYYQVPCVVLNCIGVGNVSGATKTQLENIAAFNRWLATGILNQFNAPVIDINSFWNSGQYGGISAYNNDNKHYSSFVLGDGIHFTVAGYDSVGYFIYRYGKLPRLTKIAFTSVLDPVNPPTNFNRPTTVTVGSTSYTLPNSAYDTIAVTAPVLTDTTKITITASTNVRGSSSVSGWTDIAFFLDNNPTNQVWTTQKQNYAGANTGDISANTVYIKTNTTAVSSPFILQNRDRTLDGIRTFQSDGGFNIVLNGLNTVSAPIGGAVLTVNGDINNNNQHAILGASQFNQFIQLGYNSTPGITGYGLGVYNRGSLGSGMQLETIGWLGINYWGGDNPSQNAHFLNRGFINSNAGIGNINDDNDTLSFIHNQPAYNQTQSGHAASFVGFSLFDPKPVALGNSIMFGYWNTDGNNYFGSAPTTNGRSIFGTMTDDASSRVQITGNLSMFTGKVNFAASTTSLPSLNIPGGTAPTSPSNGDMWQASNHLFARLNSVSVQLDAQTTGFAPLASPTFTGTPTLPTGTIATTQSAANNSTAIATTAYSDAATNLKANIASPTFTGTPAGPTAAVGTNTTQIASTAFVQAAIPFDDLAAMQALGSVIKAQSLGMNSPVLVNASVTMNNQQFLIQAITVKTAFTATGGKWVQAVQGSYTGNNYNGIILASYSGGTLTAIASSTTDNSIWSTATANTMGSKAFSSTVPLTPGVYYLIFLYCRSAETTAPKIGSFGSTVTPPGVDFTNSGKLFATLTGQTAVFGTLAMSTTTGAAGGVYAALYDMKTVFIFLILPTLLFRRRRMDNYLKQAA